MFYMYARTDLLEYNPKSVKVFAQTPFKQGQTPAEYVLKAKVKELVWHQFSIWHLKDLKFSMSLQ